MSENLLELLGSVLEFTGAVLMANALLGLINPLDLPRYLLSALVGGKSAKGFARLSGLSPEDYQKSLRGLALIALGWAVKLSVVVWQVVTDFQRSPARP